MEISSYLIGSETETPSNTLVLGSRCPALKSAKQWHDANPEFAKTMSIRYTATINQLIVLSKIESLNEELVKQGTSKEYRFTILRHTAEE